MSRDIGSLQQKNESENVLKNTEECYGLQKYQFFKLDARRGARNGHGMISVLHSSSALVLHFAHDFVPKKSFHFPFNFQIGTNTKSDMEKEPWIKQTQSPSPAGFKAIGLFCLIFVKFEINHCGEETEVTGSILVFKEIDRNVLWHI